MARGRKPKNPRTYKNPNGYGTVYEIKSGNRRKPFVVCVTTGWDIVIGKDEKPHKRQKKAIIGYAETYEKGMAMLADYHKRKNAGIEIVRNDATFADIYEVCLPRRLKGKSKATNYSYSAAFKLLHNLHNLPITEVKAGTIQREIDNAEEKGKKHETLSNMKMVSMMVFEYAVQNDLVSKNYAQFVNVPMNERVIKRSEFSDEEIEILWNTDIENVDTILIMLYSGIRINELLNIETINVFLDDRYFITGSKTDAGKNRIVPIARPIEGLIRKRYNANNKYLIMFGERQYSTTYYRNAIWNKIMNEVNMSHLPHDCRHTFCSVTDRAGMKRLIQQRIVGHKATNITEKVYIHKRPDELIQAVDDVWPTEKSVLATC